MTYDSNNVFAKILRAELPCKQVYEDEYCLSFYTIAPKAKLHVLVIPRGEYINYTHFIENATDVEINGFFKGVMLVAKAINVEDNCRIQSNCGEDAGQEVMHFHVHIMSDKT